MNLKEYKNKIICGDALETLKKFPDESIDCVVTSPPYFNLRDYGVEGQIGLEKTYQEFIEKLINIFDEVKRVLKKEGTCFVNLSDTFAGGGYGACTDLSKTKQGTNFGTVESRDKICQLRKENKQFSAKSLMMIPERFAIKMIESDLDDDYELRNNLTSAQRIAIMEEIKQYNEKN